jgi:hypothetical protein
MKKMVLTLALSILIITLAKASEDVIMSTSGTYTVCSANFYDAGGPSADYPNNQDVTITLLPATPGAKLSVTFGSFTTGVLYYDATTFSNFNNDILYVYNGNSIDATKIGAMRGVGYGTVTSTAADGSLTFRFVSHAYNNTSGIKAGWSATISCSSTPPNDITMIGGTFTTCGGKFYDAGGPNGEYMNNQDATLTIFPATPGAKVSVSFDSFTTAVRYYDASTFSNNNSDILYVYNGSSTAAPQIGAMQGVGYGTVSSTAADGSLTFRFVSQAYRNTSGIKAGWSATISCVSAPPDDITMIGGTYTTCSGKFYDAGGPNGDYMNNQNATLTIYPATPGAKVSVTFDYFNTAVLYYDASTFSNNNSDILYVFNGNSITAPQIGALQGQSGYGTIVSTAEDGSLTFKFISHAYTNNTGLKKGWSATISCSSAPPNIITMIAGTAFTTCSGKFYDAGGPNGDYMNNQNSTLTIFPATPGAKVSVTFDSFNTTVLYYDATTFSNNNSDVLYVYNGNSTAAPQIGALQGQSGYGTIASTAADGSLTFRFISHANADNTGLKKGWSATISCSPAPPDVITMIAGTAYTACSRKFYDSGGPDGDYMNNQNSTLTIYPSTPGAKASVTFDYFSTAIQYYDPSTFSSNNYDILYVYDGNSTAAPQIGALQGQNSYGTITSTAADGSLTFRFISHANSNNTGLKRGWSATIRCLQGEAIGTEVSAGWNGTNVENAAVYIDRGNGFQLAGTTTPTKLTVTINDLKIGDKLRAIKKVHTQKAVKTGHEMVDNTMFEVWIDSDKWNRDGSYSSVEVKTNENPISLTMKHYVFKYNLVLTTNEADWSLSDDYYNKLDSGFKEASKLLYNATDGQVRFNKIAIYDNRDNYRGSDIVLFKATDQNNARVDGIDYNNALLPSKLKLNMHQKQFYKPYHEPNQNNWYHSLIHEFGHYSFGMYDEYLNGLGNNWDPNDWNPGGPLHPKNYGLMQSHPEVTEFSSSNDYLSSYPVDFKEEEVTMQYSQRRMSCWNYLLEKLGNYYLQAVIIPPPPGYYPDKFAGDRLGPIDNSVADSTKVIDLRVSSKSASEKGFDAAIIIRANEKPVPNARIYVKGKSCTSYLGQTNVNGKVDWPGAKPESEILVYTLVANKPFRYKTTISRLNAENNINLPDLQLQRGKSVSEANIPGINISGNISYNSSFKIDLELFADYPLDKEPVINISYGVSGETISFNSISDMQHFGGSITLNPSDTEFDGNGTIDITYTYNSIEYNSVSNFSIFEASPAELCQVYNRSFNMNIDKENFADTDLGISFSTFGKPYQLTSQILYPVTDIFSIGIENTQDFLNNAGFIVSYTDAQAAGIDLSDLGIYRWDSISKEWKLESTSTLNPEENSLSCYVASTGIYGVFTTKLADDIITPSTVNDLASKTGEGQAMIDLSWSAPGDDGITGTTMYYIIKYNSVPVTDLNWDESYDISNEPVPLPYGAKESISVSLPSQNALYYFAIKSVDEAGNTSEISNSTASVSSTQSYTFSLLTPEFNYTIDNLSPTFTWESYDEADVQSYTLMIADNDLFENAVIINDISTNSFQIQYLLDYDKPYFWKVKALTVSSDFVDCNQSYLRFLTGTITHDDQNLMPEIKDNYCYPNPFNPDNQYCTIRFSGSDPQACYAKIFDISGKQIKLIREKDNKTDIERVIYWDGTNSSNSKVHDGIYIYEITSGSGLKISGKILISR